MKRLIQSIAIVICFLGFSVVRVEAAKPTAASFAVSMPASSQENESQHLQVTNNQKINFELIVAVSKLAAANLSVAQLIDRMDQAAYKSPWLDLAKTLLPAVLVAIIALTGQLLMMRHQRKINKNDADAKIENTYVEWQLKQLSELYAPLRALLWQSNILYRQMNKVLEAADPERFRTIAGEDFDNQVFEILVNDKWVRFRTVKHLVEIYGKNYGVEPYFDDVVAVGERMANIIREKAGYARQEDGELVKIMGEYLAHYFVLRRLHKQAQEKEYFETNSADEQATFPAKIQNLVENGFQDINKRVLQWRAPQK